MATKLVVGAWPGCQGRCHCCAPPANQSITSCETLALGCIIVCVCVDLWGQQNVVVRKQEGKPPCEEQPTTDCFLKTRALDQEAICNTKNILSSFLFPPSSPLPSLLFPSLPPLPFPPSSSLPSLQPSPRGSMFSECASRPPLCGEGEASGSHLQGYQAHAAKQWWQQRCSTLMQRAAAPPPPPAPPHCRCLRCCHPWQWCHW